MFDLLIRDDLQSVPTPLPGRAIVFAGPGGGLMLRRADGGIAQAYSALMAIGTGTVNAGVAPVVALAGVGVDRCMNAGALKIKIRGDYWNDWVAMKSGTLNVVVRLDGAVKSTLTKLFSGTGAAILGQGWQLDVDLLFAQKHCFPSMVLKNQGQAGVLSEFGLPFDVAPGQTLDVAYYLSAATPGIEFRVLAAYAVEEFAGVA